MLCVLILNLKLDFFWKAMITKAKFYRDFYWLVAP